MQLPDSIVDCFNFFFGSLAGVFFFFFRTITAAGHEQRNLKKKRSSPFGILSLHILLLFSNRRLPSLFLFLFLQQLPFVLLFFLFEIIDRKWNSLLSKLDCVIQFSFGNPGPLKVSLIDLELVVNGGVASGNREIELSLLLL